MSEPGPDTTLTAFLAHLGHERRLSPLTLTNYRRDLERIGAWRAGAGLGLDWAAMTPEEGRRYIRWRPRGGAGGQNLHPCGSSEYQFFQPVVPAFWQAFFRQIPAPARG